MKKIISALAITFSAIAFSACNSAGTSSDKETSADTANKQLANARYSCPMHAEVVSDKPGTCPKCKMDLVQANQGASEDSSHSH